MIISGVTLTGASVYDAGFNSNGALLYLDAGDTASYSGSGTTWTDLSTYQNNATLTNSPTWTSAGTGSYFSFNGSNQYAPVTQSKMNVTYTGKTTMFAIRTVNANTGNGVYRCLFGGDGVRNFNTYMYHVSGSTWELHFSSGSGSLAGGISAPFTVVDNQWIMVAVTQTTGGDLAYYVNGQQIGTVQTGVTFSQYLSGGTEAVAKADNYWVGDIGICAIYGRVLNPSEILQNYYAFVNKYSSVSSNLVAYYNPDLTTSYPGTGTILYDLSGNSLNGTMSNLTYTDPYLTYNGTSSTVSIADNALLEPGTGDFSLEAWVYYSTITGSTRTFISKTDNGGVTAAWSYGFRTLASGSTYLEVGSGSASVTSPAYTVSTGQWYQIVGVWTNVASNSIALYINGVSQGSNSHAFASVKNSTNPLYLGSYNGGEYAQWFNGRMGIVRYYNTALTAAQITQNYNANRSTYGL